MKSKEFNIVDVSNGEGISNLAVVIKEAIEDIEIGTILLVPYVAGFKTPKKALLMVDDNDKPIKANNKFAIVLEYIYR